MLPPLTALMGGGISMVPLFPTDRRSIIRCVRAFFALLADRLEHGDNTALPNGLTLDQVMTGLALHEANWDATASEFGLVNDESEADWIEEITRMWRQILEGSDSGPGNAWISVN